MRRTRRGNATAIVLLLPALLSMGALAVDLGQARTAKAQLQAATDHMVRGAVGYLDGTEYGLSEAKRGASQVAALNSVYGAEISIVDIEFGYWNVEDYDYWWERWNSDGTYSTRDAAFVQTNDPELVDAVRITTSTTSPTYFAGLIMADDLLGVGATSTATQLAKGAGSVDCFIPLAIPDCAITQDSKETIQEMEFRLSPAGIDNAGYSVLTAYGSPNSSNLIAQINDCTVEGEAVVGDSLWLDNGQKASVFQAIADRIDASTDTWDESVYEELPEQQPSSAVTNYGNVYEGPIMVFEGSADYCAGNGSWTESNVKIVGFAWGAVYDVIATTEDKNLRMRIDLEREHEWGNDPGGENFGVVTYSPKLVR